MSVQTIEIDEADGIGTYGGVEADRWAGEVFIGGTKARPLVIIYECDDSGESGPDWQVDDITLFHPDGREEQVDWNTLIERMTYKEVGKLTDKICDIVTDDMDYSFERYRELAEDATRETNP